MPGLTCLGTGEEPHALAKPEPAAARRGGALSPSSGKPALLHHLRVAKVTPRPQETARHPGPARGPHSCQDG